jgi:hypothetical protein
VFDGALEGVSLQSSEDDVRLTLKTPSVKSVYALYDAYSSIDCCYSGRQCNLLSTDWECLMPGNTDSLSNDDLLDKLVRQRSNIDEVRTVIDELMCTATKRWTPVERSSDQSPCVEDRAMCLRQDVGHYEK